MSYNTITTNFMKWKEGKELVVQQEYQKAIRVYQHALKKEEHPFTYFEIGECYFLLEKYEKASEYFEKGMVLLEDETAIELAHYFYRYATVLVQQGHFLQAYEYSKKSVLIARNIDNLYNHATICFSLAYVEKAVPTLAYCALKAPQQKEIKQLIKKNQEGIDAFWGTAETEERKIRVILTDFPDGIRLSSWIIDASQVQQDLYFPHWGSLMQAFLNAQFDISSIFIKRLINLAFASSQVGTLIDFLANHFQQDIRSFLDFLADFSFPVEKLKESYTPQTIAYLYEIVQFLLEKKQLKKALEWANYLQEMAPLAVEGYLAQAMVAHEKQEIQEVIAMLVKAGMLNKRKIAHLKWIESYRTNVNEQIANYWKNNQKTELISTVLEEIATTYDYSKEEIQQVQQFLTASKTPTFVPVFYHWQQVAAKLVQQFLSFDDAVLLRIYAGAFEKEEQLAIFQFLWNHFSTENPLIFELLLKSNITIIQLIDSFLLMTDYEENSYDELAAFLIISHEKQVIQEYSTIQKREIWTKLLLKMGENPRKAVKKNILNSSFEFQKQQTFFEYQDSYINLVQENAFTEQVMAKRIAISISQLVQAKKMKNNLANQVEDFLLKGKKADDFDQNLQEFAQKLAYHFSFEEHFIQEIDYQKDSEFFQRLLYMMAYLQTEWFLLQYVPCSAIEELVNYFEEKQLPLELLLVYTLRENEKSYFEFLTKTHLSLVQQSMNWLDNASKIQLIEQLWEQFQEQIIPWFLEEGMQLGTAIRHKIMELLQGNIYAYQYTETLLASKKQNIREVGLSILLGLQSAIFERLKTHYYSEKSEELSTQLAENLTAHNIKAFKETTEEKVLRFEKIGEIIESVLVNKNYVF